MTGDRLGRSATVDLGTVVRVTILIVVIVVLVLLAAGAWFGLRSRRAAVTAEPGGRGDVPSPAAQGRVPVAGEPPIVGPPTAPETTVETGVSTPPQGIPAQIPPSAAITPPEGFPAQGRPAEGEHRA